MNSVLDHNRDQKLTQVPMTASEVLQRRVDFYKSLRATYLHHSVWKRFNLTNERKLPSD